jgi:hypothetical protein
VLVFLSNLKNAKDAVTVNDKQLRWKSLSICVSTYREKHIFIGVVTVYIFRHPVGHESPLL